MGSFYGGGGGGTVATSNYNELANAPVKNIGVTGEGVYTSLPGLTYGHYSLTGNYKIDSSDDIITTNVPIDLLVYQDDKTGNKIEQYFSSEDGHTILNTYIYDKNNQLVEKSKTDLMEKGTPLWGTF